ncbi:F-box domain-containing protein [Mycena sanguinolenta]|uniref:F-box domain-containing protein n=1 Tax=Mycena sanguinolenta TaxID=230812 RepID=A0A8H6YS40_9AGAR|nr:F-box domain-containing protein [Mycena sanguinolenta]
MFISWFLQNPILNSRITLWWQEAGELGNHLIVTSRQGIKSRLSPTLMTNFEKLPFELNSKIFLHCLPHDGRVHPNTMAAPLVLSQICSHWRAITLATPQIWSSIFFEFPHDSQYYGLSFLFGDETTPTIDRIVPLVDLWFSRSNGHPLSITIRCRQRGLRCPQGLMTVLANKSAQWQRLELMLSRMDFLELDSAPGPFTCLRSLALNINDHLPPSLTWNSDRYIRAPSLAVLRLGSSLSRTALLTGEATAPRLTALEFSTAYAALVVSVLHHLPHLQHLIVHRLHVYYPACMSKSTSPQT